jgi:Flp pilus assembly protein TadG
MTMAAFIRRLARDTGGMAFIELALVLPMLLTFGLGMIELGRYVIAVERVNQIAMIVSDGAARVRDSIDEADINDIMQGAKLVGSAINFTTNGRIILSGVQMNDAGNGQWVRWQRCKGAKTVTSAYHNVNDGKTDASVQYMGPANQNIAAIAGTSVMFVEVYYDYQPIIPWPIAAFRGRTLKAMQAYNVRQRDPQPSANPDVLNQQNLAVAQTSACTVYST